MLILGQKYYYLEPTILKIPQPNWYYSTSQLFAPIAISDCVLGAGFTSLTFDAKSSKGKNSPKDFTLSTSPMLATLEKLKKNDEIWIRWVSSTPFGIPFCLLVQF